MTERGEVPMKIEYYSLSGIYDIPIKRFEPEGAVTGFIVAVHGFGGDKESSAIEALAERMTAWGFAVIAFDFPAHGASKADGYFCTANCRLDLMNVFEHACGLYPEAERKTVFATSFGGYITLLSLDSLPGDVRIVLRAPAVDMKATFERMLPLALEEYKRAGAVELGFERKLDVPYSFYTELCEADISRKDIQREMLIIHGSEDELVLPEHIRRFCEVNPKARLEVIEGADHRFKGEGEIGRVINSAEKYITG
ncbi:MAG: alpha/beta fold hydrolase [Ruminococcus sp.]|nr:alpha/beta fold hydrolase [Ruminococcus sp.]